MNKLKFFVFALIIFCLSSFSSAFAQTDKIRQSEPNYEVSLQMLIASKDSTKKSEIPANLTDTVNKFKKNFPYSTYRTIFTNFQRVENKGNIVYRSLLNEISPDAGQSVFQDWRLEILEKETNGNGENSVSFQRFSFQARIPVTYVSFNESKSSTPITNYENIGVTLQRFSLPENTPTLIATLSTPPNDEMIFFILTVNPVK